MIDFPANPTVGQAFTAPNGTVWIWDGVKWTGTGNPWSNVRYRNRIINGDMSVDQRNGGTVIAQPPASGGYAIDRWKFGSANSVTGKGQVGQAPIGIVGGAFTFGLQWNTTTAYAIVAADGFGLYQAIEGYNFNDAQWGAASAQPVVLEFWVYAPVSGTYGGSIRNGAANRTYAFTYVVPTANVWTKVRLNIPADTTGTWVVAGNALAVYLNFSLGTGATYQAPSANTWVAGNFLASAGTVSVLAATGNFYITGVALMVGAAAANAEPEFKKYSDNLIDCQRYYQKGNFAYYGYGLAANYFGGSWMLPVAMRAGYTAVPVFNNANISSPNLQSTNPGYMSVVGTAVATGAVQLAGSYTADADF